MGVNKSPLGNFVALISLGLERGSSEGEGEVGRHAQDAAFFPDIHAAELQKAGLSVMLGVAKDGLGCLGPPIPGLDFDHGRTPFPVDDEIDFEAARLAEEVGFNSALAKGRGHRCFVKEALVHPEFPRLPKPNYKTLFR